MPFPASSGSRQRIASAMGFLIAHRSDGSPREIREGGLPAVARCEREVRLRQGCRGQPSREYRAKAGAGGQTRTDDLLITNRPPTCFGPFRPVASLALTC